MIWWTPDRDPTDVRRNTFNIDYASRFQRWDTREEAEAARPLARHPDGSMRPCNTLPEALRCTPYGLISTVCQTNPPPQRGWDSENYDRLIRDLRGEAQAGKNRRLARLEKGLPA